MRPKNIIFFSDASWKIGHWLIIINCVMNVKNVTNRAGSAWGQLLSAAASFCFQMVNLSFSPSLSASFTFCYNLKQGRARAGREDERGGMGGVGGGMSWEERQEVIRKILLLPSSLSWLASCQQAEKIRGDQSREFCQIQSRPGSIPDCYRNKNCIAA